MHTRRGQKTISGGNPESPLRLDWPAVHPGEFPSPQYRYYKSVTPCPIFLCRLRGIKLRPSYLEGKFFTNWAISPVLINPQLLKFHVDPNTSSGTVYSHFINVKRSLWKPSSVSGSLSACFASTHDPICGDWRSPPIFLSILPTCPGK